MLSRPAILLLASALATSGCLEPPVEVAWHEVSGASLTLRSCGDSDQTLALAAGLAETRASLVALLPEIPASGGAHFTVHIFCRSSDYLGLAPDPHQANHFVAQPLGKPRVDSSYEAQQVATATSVRGTRMAVRGAQLRRASNLVRHHYVHHLVRSHVEIPLWIEEGLASFVGTAQREASGVRRGKASTGMYSLVRLTTQLPLGRVFRATDLRTWAESDFASFYRSSWLVVHYMHFGSVARREPASARIQRYIAAHAKGSNEFEATQAAFGQKTTGLRNALVRYVRIHRTLLRSGRVTPPYDRGAGLAVHSLPKASIAYQLGVFALENREGAKAERHFVDAAPAQAPDNARAHAGRARALALQGRGQEAVAALHRADALAPNDLRVLLDGAWVHTAGGGIPPGLGDVEAVRTRVGKVLAKAPELAEAHYLMGLSHGRSSELGARIAALERAHAASPGAIEVAMRLASTLAYAGRVEKARALGTRVAGWVLGESRDREVYAFLDELPKRGIVDCRRLGAARCRAGPRSLGPPVPYPSEAGAERSAASETTTRPTPSVSGATKPLS